MQTTDQERDLLARILLEHQEKPHGDMSAPQLRLHVALHAVVEQQLEQREPEAVNATLARLMAAGLSRHAAIHAICSVAGRELGDTLEGGGTYDEDRYVERLAELEPE